MHLNPQNLNKNQTMISCLHYCITDEDLSWLTKKRSVGTRVVSDDIKQQRGMYEIQMSEGWQRAFVRNVEAPIWWVKAFPSSFPQNNLTLTVLGDEGSCSWGELGWLGSLIFLDTLFFFTPISRNQLDFLPFCFVIAFFHPDWSVSCFVIIFLQSDWLVCIEHEPLSLNSVLDCFSDSSLDFVLTDDCSELSCEFKLISTFSLSEPLVKSKSVWNSDNSFPSEASHWAEEVSPLCLPPFSSVLLSRQTRLFNLFIVFSVSLCLLLQLELSVFVFLRLGLGLVVGLSRPLGLPLNCNQFCRNCWGLLHLIGFGDRLTGELGVESLRDLIGDVCGVVVLFNRSSKAKSICYFCA
jgi:hypothetical protein